MADHVHRNAQLPPGLSRLRSPLRFPARLCAPYRAQTKGKVERFIRYLRHSFYVPIASRLAQEGLIVDRETANLAARRWLREVANVRVHGTTGEVPADRLAIERCSCSRCRRLTPGAACARFRSRCRHPSSACSTRCRSTMPSPAARHERAAASAHRRAVPGTAAERSAQPVFRRRPERGDERGLLRRLS